MLEHRALGKDFASIDIHVRALEIARGFDGWLRGDPEPVLLLAVYAVAGSHRNLLARDCCRILSEGPFPKLLTLPQPMHLRAEVPLSPSLCFVVVAIGLEEDADVETQRVYGLLERPEDLGFWSIHHHEPVPIGIVDLPRDQENWQYPRRTHLLADGRHVEGTCKQDKWIGCSAWSVFPRGQQARYRAHFLSSDQKNDWTALIDVTA